MTPGQAPSTRTVIGGSILLAYMLCVVALVVQVGGRSTGVRAWRDLVAALPAVRHLEPRISVLPFAQRVRSSDTATAAIAKSPEILRACAALEEHARHEPSPTTSRWAAVCRLMIDDAERAVMLLERAVAMAPHDHSLRSDLAAAYLVRAERVQTRLDLVRALDAAGRVTAAAPEIGAAWFNQALALERLGLVDDARDAWRRAASTERGGWAEEAAHNATAVAPLAGRTESLARLERMAQDDVRSLSDAALTDPDLVGEIVERRLLRTCTQALLSGDRGGAASCHATARTVASSIARGTSEAMFVDLVDDLHTCGERCATGWLHHLNALDRWDAEDYGGARVQSARADAAFAPHRHPSPVDAARLYLQTTIDRLDGKRDRALARLDALRNFTLERRYWTAAGRLQLQSALLASENGSFAVAIARYLSASELFGRARNREGRAIVEALVSQNYQFLDDLGQAWDHELEGLAGLPHARPARRVPILSLAAILASASNLDAAALAFRAPLIREAREQGSKPRLVNRLAEESGVLKNLGLLDRARASVQEAAEHARTITDPALASLAHALVQTWSGRLLADESPLEAVAALGEAVEIYRRRGDMYAIPELQLDRGRALVRADRLAEAEAAFADGIAAAEQQRRGGTSDAARAGVLSARWDLYAWLVELRLRRDETAALSLLHEMRAVNLAERLGGHVASPPYMPPAGTIFVEYAMLPSALHGWVTTASGQRHFVIAMPIAMLIRHIDEYRDAIARREEPRLLHARSHAVYEALVEPIAADIASARRIVIVPDGPLHDLPFAALEDPARRRFLVQDVSIVVTPSLDFQFRAPREPNASAARFAALVVGNPERRLAVQDRVPALPDADREARAIAPLYTPSALALGSDATREFFLEHAARTRMVHFAGHALVSEQRPQSSRLLFAASADDPIGVLFASDIEGLALAGVRLVVLAACDTARGRLARGEGIVGLVRAFLSAGVPSVAATLWAVDDRATASLFTAFHREWTTGADSSDALRTAQLELIGSGAPVIDWAGALVVGRSVTERQEE